MGRYCFLPETMTELGMRPPGATPTKPPAVQPQPASALQICSSGGGDSIPEPSQQRAPSNDEQASPTAEGVPCEDPGDSTIEGPDASISPRSRRDQAPRGDDARASAHGGNTYRRAGSRGSAACGVADGSGAGQDHEPAAEVQCNGPTRPLVPPASPLHAAPSLAASSSAVVLPHPTVPPLSPKPVPLGGPAGVLQQDVQPLLLQDVVEAMRWCLEKDRHYHKVWNAVHTHPICQLIYGGRGLHRAGELR